MRNLGQEFQLAPDATFDDLDRELKRRIAALAPNDNAVFLQEIQRLRLLAKQIQDRGGRVVFIRLPESGYVREMDERRYPRALFWDHFAAGIGAPTLNFADVAGLKEFNCPDGSHLDYRDRARFTRALLAALDMKASGTGGE
jgi:hypothetical protein